MIYFENVLVWSGKISLMFFCIPIIIGVWNYTKLGNPLKLFLIFLVSILCINIIDIALVWHVGKYYISFWKPILDDYKITDTNFLNILNRINDYVFIGWIFSFLFNPFRINLKYFGWSLIPISIIIYFFIDGFRSYGNANAILNRLFLIIIPVMYFWKVSKEPMAVSIWKNPFFLISIGLFLPNLFSFYMSFFGDKLNETDFKMFVKLSVVRNVFTIFGQVFFALAFFRTRYAKFLVAN